MQGLKRSRWAGVVLLLVVSLIAEIFVFNFRFFGELLSGAPQKMLGAAAFTVEENGALSDTGLTVTGNSVFTISPGVPVRTLAVNIASDGPVTLSVSYTDQSFSESTVDAGSWTIDPEVPGSDQIRLVSAGKCGQVKFWVTKAEGTFTVRSVTFNRPYFSFHPFRFLLVFLLLLFVRRICRKGLFDERLEPGGYRAHKALFIVFSAAGVLAVLLYALYGDMQPFSGTVLNTGDCYTLLTQAFSHGQIAFLEQPSKALTALSNPYDLSLRSGISYIWDSAYYNGHYYCYFGVAPVLTLLLPFKLLTGLYMPTSFAGLVYFLALLFAALHLYNAIVRKWFEQIGYAPFVGGAAAVVFCANLYWLIARPLFYELAVTSALFYLFLGFALLLRATEACVRRPKLTLFFSGLCFALTVASRPTYLFYLAAAIPLLVPVMLKTSGNSFKTHGFLNKIRSARLQTYPFAAFFTPLAAAAVLLMLYNAARFGSPFDFGQRYQLTVSDVRYNTMSNLAAIPGGLYHYFFAPLTVNLTFPFFHVAQTAADTSSGYVYNQPMAGLFNFPLLLILFASAYIFKRMGKDRRDLRAFTAILLAMALFVTLLDINLAGVLERYTLDIGPVLVFVSLILWFEVLCYFKSKRAGVPAAKLFFAVCAVTAVISTLCSCVGEGDSLIQSRPEIYQMIVQAVEFWR